MGNDKHIRLSGNAGTTVTISDRGTTILDRFVVSMGVRNDAKGEYTQLCYAPGESLRFVTQEDGASCVWVGMTAVELASSDEAFRGASFFDLPLAVPRSEAA